jgi:hypothetical protein
MDGSDRSDTQDRQSGLTRAAIIGGSFTIAAAIISGIFLLLSASSGGSPPQSQPTLRPKPTTTPPATPATTTPSSSAGQLALGRTKSGGGGAIDFWNVHLTGGDRVQFVTAQPTYEPGTFVSTNYVYGLYPPGTTDKSIAGKSPLDSAATAGAPTGLFVLQAPYTGTFVLAVCENPEAGCGSIGPGSGLNPMQPYTFTTHL